MTDFIFWFSATSRLALGYLDGRSLVDRFWFPLVVIRHAVTLLMLARVSQLFLLAGDGWSRLRWGLWLGLRWWLRWWFRFWCDLAAGFGLNWNLLAAIFLAGGVVLSRNLLSSFLIIFIFIEGSSLLKKLHRGSSSRLTKVRIICLLQTHSSLFSRGSNRCHRSFYPSRC